jgi:hypothetical protein
MEFSVLKFVLKNSPKSSDLGEWRNMSEIQELSKEFIEKHSEKVDWAYISLNQTLSEEFIEKFSEKVQWYSISRHQNLSEEFIEKFSDKVDWYGISFRQKLSEEFIEKFSDKVHWECICSHQTLSEEFIEKFSEKIYWYGICSHQKLSEEFIEKYSEKVHWFSISWMQSLSLEFLIRNSDKINFKTLYNNKISTIFSNKNIQLTKFSSEPDFFIITDKTISIHKEFSSFLFNLSLDKKTIQIPDPDDFLYVEEIIDIAYKRKQLSKVLGEILMLYIFVKKFCFDFIEDFFIQSILEKITPENYRTVYNISQDNSFKKLEDKLFLCLEYF